MAKVSTYLNFKGKTEEAFNFYKKVFRSEFAGQGLMKFSSVPPMDGAPALSPSEMNQVMHVELPILGGVHSINGSDAPESHGYNIIVGNNVSIVLNPESREETDRLFKELSAGGQVTGPLTDMFWGAYFGTCVDKFGVCWMFNFDKNAQ
jgi:PhnB protein